jgi:hypothetical protein
MSNSNPNFVIEPHTNSNNKQYFTIQGKNDYYVVDGDQIKIFDNENLSGDATKTIPIMENVSTTASQQKEESQKFLDKQIATIIMVNTARIIIEIENLIKKLNKERGVFGFVLNPIKGFFKSIFKKEFSEIKYDDKFFSKNDGMEGNVINLSNSDAKDLFQKIAVISVNYPILIPGCSVLIAETPELITSYQDNSNDSNKTNREEITNKIKKSMNKCITQLNKASLLIDKVQNIQKKIINLLDTKLKCLENGNETENCKKKLLI